MIKTPWISYNYVATGISHVERVESERDSNKFYLQSGPTKTPLISYVSAQLICFSVTKNKTTKRRTDLLYKIKWN